MKQMSKENSSLVLQNQFQIKISHPTVSHYNLSHAPIRPYQNLSALEELDETLKKKNVEAEETTDIEEG